MFQGQTIRFFDGHEAMAAFAAAWTYRDVDDAATRDFAGHLDDFRIYGRALAAGEALGLVSPVSTVSRQYVWGLYIDELLQQKNLIGGPSGGAAGQEAGGHYLMSDLLYRAAALVTPDSGETSGVRILENYDFDAYGNTLIFNAPGTGDDWWAPDAQQTPTPACRYLFTGREYDAESGLYYYRARFYWPELGRFGQRDPIGYGAGMGLYAYVNGSPVRKFDPMGLFEEWGHYYTTAWISQACGDSSDKAYELAYFSQYPDEHSMWDAYATQVDYVARASASLISPGIPGVLNSRKHRDRVHNYLHSLHGGGPDAVKLRRKCLKCLIKSARNGNLVPSLTNAQIGLLIHAFGDSYAHTTDKPDGPHAYSTGWGHAFPSFYNDNPDDLKISSSYGRWREYVTELADALGCSKDQYERNVAFILPGLDVYGNKSRERYQNHREMAASINPVITALADGFHGKWDGVNKDYRPERNHHATDDKLEDKIDNSQVNQVIDLIRDKCVKGGFPCA